MFRRIFVFAIVFLSVCGLGAEPLKLRSSQGETLFGDKRFAVRFDANTGWPGEVLCDGKVVIHACESKQCFDLKQDEEWVTGGGQAVKSLGVDQLSADTVRSRMRVGEWSVDVNLQMFPEKRMLRKWFEISWNGDEPTKIKALWFQEGVLKLGGGGGYFCPASYPPEHIQSQDLVKGHKSHSGRSPYPVIGDAGNGWSVLWVADEMPAYSDRGSAEVKEGDDSISVTRAFNIQGHMRKGVKQLAGDAWLWVLPTDGDTALRRMPEWFQRVGQLPPADRPAWLKRVILYSFHPGGTTGSLCQDLGGFKAATDLLSHINDLGCNAIWLMPLEDKSIYWPRDYYKLQEGLGSPDDYKALTAKAHQLGMRVWQDCVPHGGCNEYPRAKEHPEWLVRREDGSTLYYWCFDFNWPSWIQYMSDVVTFYTREYELDGFRIDACGGSKIPNWNPDIPYARASHSQAQGGLAMQRALRKAVKAVRPDGANLAEVGASIHGAVSDSTYDFELCYRVMHDYRKLPASEFVANLQQWLHEQKYAEIPDLVRMRHLESHDSLRSGLWYGAAPQRALQALISWIHGMPLVYHEMEDGNTDYFRHMFYVRNHVAELNMGSADYRAVKAPDGVFACLRGARLPAREDPYWSDDYSWDTQPDSVERSSIVLVNLNGSPVEGAVTVSPKLLPESLRGCKWVRDLISGEKLNVKNGSVNVALPAFGYTALRFESKALPEMEPLASEPVEYEVAESPVTFKLKCVSGALVFDSKTGLPTAWKSGWFSSMPLLMDIALPDTVAAAGSVVPSHLHNSRKKAATTHVFGNSSLETRYETVEDGVRVHARWTGEAPDGAGLLFEIPEAETWSATSAEGRFESPFRVRHPECDGVKSSIYRRPQGTAVLWDSRLHPFGLNERYASVGALCEQGRLCFDFDPDYLPAAVQILDRVGDNHGMKVLIRWRDQSDGVKVGGDELLFTIRNRSVEDKGAEIGTGDDRLVQEAGGWRFENKKLRVRFARNGSLSGIWRSENGSWQQVLDNGYVYNDRGYGSGKRYAQENDVEAYVRMNRYGARVKISFVGALRGFYRFDKMARPISFHTEYIFDDGDDFAYACAVKPETPASGESAFLAMTFRASATVRAEFLDGKQVLMEGDRISGKGRYLQTSKSADPGHMPTSIQLSDANVNRLCLNDISWFGALPMNVFMCSEDLYLAWMDGPIGPSIAGQWSGMRCRIGFEGEISDVTEKADIYFQSFVDNPSEILRDGDFEGEDSRRMVLLSRGAELASAGDGSSAWLMPESAERVEEDGRSCVRVVGDGEGYLLIRQALPIYEFKSGTTWRLHADIKARGIEKGDPSWKTACLRWAVYAGGKAHYASASQPPGNSDWHPVRVDVKMPDDIQSIFVEAGLNGNRGTIWVDDIWVEKIEE